MELERDSGAAGEGAVGADAIWGSSFNEWRSTHLSVSIVSEKW
jgi:hypothetical protein